ncbi:unnamed protein product [Cylicocyclus nassatus]|uniref:DNA methylase N-4/N-6 domain-containing protein n=1 Tax=Cylicocyclus nassatus TaxID=53992 RepID=A0AA36DSK7_CYLNA|nr:unnamed protein product [Cylicocyclus nassatus]
MPENTTHPTQKPEKLLERVIKASCPVGGNVLDVFAGSGSTLVAAKKLGRFKEKGGNTSETDAEPRPIVV